MRLDEMRDMIDIDLERLENIQRTIQRTTDVSSHGFHHSVASVQHMMARIHNYPNMPMPALPQHTPQGLEPISEPLAPVMNAELVTQVEHTIQFQTPPKRKRPEINELVWVDAYGPNSVTVTSASQKKVDGE